MSFSSTARIGGLALAFVGCGLFWSTPASAQTSAPAQAQSGKPELVLLDTDIGDDIDDAFALALVLQSPELKLLGVSTTWGDTPLRARLVRRMLKEADRPDIPVAEGQPTTTSTPFTQAAGHAEILTPPTLFTPSIFFCSRLQRIPAK
jgi:hypothetical protein